MYLTQQGPIHHALHVHQMVKYIDEKKIFEQIPSPSGVFLLTSGLRPQFLGRALAALRSIGMANRHENQHSA
jgi:hypothetical protein